MQTWSTLLSADEAREVFSRHYQPTPVPEDVDTSEALGRVLAAEVRSPEDLPPFRRSLMDGFAVRSQDVQSVPVSLRLIGDVRMGSLAECRLGPGEAAGVPTGGIQCQAGDQRIGHPAGPRPIR